MRNLLSNIKSRLTKVTSALSILVPKKRNLWVFGAWQGQQYSDNTKYLFEYVATEHPEIVPVWITRNKDVQSQMNSFGYKCFNRYSIKGIWSVLRAKVALETEGNQDISPFLNNHVTKTIQLWHGFPLKAMRWKKSDGSAKMRSARVLNKFYWISCSNEYTKLMNELLGIDMDRFRLTGFPRNDTFVNAPINSKVLSFMQSKKNNHFLIYLPTHRNFGAEGNLHINIDAFSQLDEMLKKSNLVLVYKPHFHEMKNFEGLENLFDNIYFAKETYWNDVYSYLHMFDILISDYSSVAVDYICCGKPVVLFPYDLENYKDKDAGLTDCYYNAPIGPMCFTWREVIDNCKSLLISDGWEEKRLGNLKVFQEYNDGKNCERVFEYAYELAMKGNKR